MNDQTLRIVLNYSVQTIFGVILFIIFTYFSKVYQRKFLKSWSWHWVAFVIYFLCNTLMFIWLRWQSPWRLSLSFIAQVSSFLQVTFLLVGIYEIFSLNSLSRKKYLLLIALCIVLALLTVIPFMNDPQALKERLLLRVGLRTVIVGLGYVAAGIITLISIRFTRGLGQKILGFAFVSYGINLMVFAFIVSYGVIRGENMSYDFSLVEVLMLCTMGLAMIMWLLEDERERLAKANRELDSFLYSTSHDLRAPIASILGITSLSKHEITDEKSGTFMQMIEDRVKKLDTVITDIQTLSRSNKVEITSEEIHFKALLHDTVSDVKFAGGISLEYTEDPSHVFRSDYNQMKTFWVI